MFHEVRQKGLKQQKRPSKSFPMVPFDRRHTWFPISVPLQLCLYVNKISSLISQNLKMSRDSGHILLGVIYHACTRTYSSVSISARNWKYLASPITKIGAKFKKPATWLTTPLLGVVCHCRLGYDTDYLHAKCNDSNFSRSRDIIVGVKF